MIPVAFALFIIALVWPLQRRLQAVLPQVVAVLVTAAAALLAIGVGGWLIVWGFGGIAQWVIANAARLQGLYMHAADLLEQRGLYAAELFAEQVNVLWLVQVLRGDRRQPAGHSYLRGRDLHVRHPWAARIGAARASPSSDGRRAVWRGRDRRGSGNRCAIADLHAGSLRHERADGARLLGLYRGLRARSQREWGVIAFVLNFIPFIGSFVATLLPTLFAAAQYESLYAAIVIFIGLNVLQFVVGSYIEPRVAGAAVSVSPFMVLFAVFFWGMLWGVAGAFIGVPILIALAQPSAPGIPATRPIAVAAFGGSARRK